MKLFDANGLQKRTTVPSLPGAVSDTLGASVNDYSPTGWGSTVNRLKITPASGGTTLTGLDASVHTEGDLVVVQNETASVQDSITLPNESASSAAANRFTGIAGEDYDILPGAAVLLLRGATRWRIVS